MFSIDGNTIKITRGDTGIFSLDLTSNGEPYDYSEDTVLFTVKYNTIDRDAVIQKTVAYGESVVIQPTDTNKLPFGDYVYDVQVTTQAGLVDTVIPPSKFIILPEVTF